MVAEGVRRGNPGAVANGIVAFATSLVRSGLERYEGAEFRPWQRVYVETALLAHAYGMLGRYEDTWWWDHLTHTLSSTLLAGLTYVVSDRRNRDPRRDVLVAIAGGGVLWEALEYAIHGISARLGVEPLLVPYSVRDTALDLAFNFLGGALVVAFGDRLLDNFSREN